MKKEQTTTSFNITSFITQETLGGFLLILASVIAVIWANSGFAESYEYFWHKLKLGISLGDQGLKYSLQHWINDGLMAVFFFMIGLEIKREVLAGELSTMKKATLPLMAAIGGMVVPALFFVFVNFRNPESLNGWGVPMATDIAFSLGILSMLGKRVNINIKIFLTALAIADDLGAILVIAVFYTETIHLSQLLNAGIFLLILMAANRMGVRRTTFYALVGLIGVWLSFIFSGVHATIAGVLIALTIPVRPKISEYTFICKLESLINKFRKEESNDSSLLTSQQSHLISEIEKTSDDAHTPLQKLEHALHPVVAWFILPVFALSNAGVRIEGNILDMLLHPLSLGIIFGLVAGKFIGISLFTYLGVRFKIASMPESVRWRDIYGAAMLAGIGFTMSMFISDLAFADDELIAISKVGIFTASILAAMIGVMIFLVSPSGSKK